MQHYAYPYDQGGASDGRGRSPQPVANTPPSRSGERTRPLYKDSRRDFISPTQTMEAPYLIHRIPLSEPNYHDVDERRMYQSRSLSPAGNRRATQQSRSLSPAGNRRVKTTPYAPPRMMDPQQRYVEEAYSQRFYRAHHGYMDRKQMTESLLMFNDAYDTASAVTGLSEQELIKKKQKEKSRKEKKNKKKNEGRILNFPAILRRSHSADTSSPSRERKRYYRGADDAAGAMTRASTQKRDIAVASPPRPTEVQPRKNWTIVPALSRSVSDNESTQSSTEPPEDMTNPAARRWIQAKQRRRQKDDFPLLSTMIAEKGPIKKKDAPGPVARKPSPVLHDHVLAVDAPEDPVEQVRIEHRGSDGVTKWAYEKPELNVTPESGTSLRVFDGSMSAIERSLESIADDGSPTSIMSRLPYEKESSKRSQKPKSILRNSPQKMGEVYDGTYPLVRPRSTNRETGQDLPRRVQTRFSDSVQQKTFDITHDHMDHGYEQDAAYANHYNKQGVFPIHQRIKPENEYSKNHFGQDPTRMDYKEGAPYREEVGSTTYGSDEGSESYYSVEFPETDDGTKISKAPSLDEACFKDSSGKILSPIRSKRHRSIAGYLDDSIDIDGHPSIQVTESRHREPTGISSPDRLASKSQVYEEMSPPENDKELYETTTVPISSSFDTGEFWANDEEYDIRDQDFEDNVNSGFMRVVAAVVIQTTVRRFLAIRTFERMIQEHFEFIAGPDLMTPVAKASSEDSITDEMPALNPLVSLRGANRRKLGSLSQKHQPFRPDPPPQNESERLRLNISCAIKIQRVFRGWWVRDSMYVDHYCATLIQKLVRGFLARANFCYDMYRIIMVQSYVRMTLTRELAVERLACVLGIQTNIRGYLVRKRLRGSCEGKLHLAQHVAAIKIQSRCRAYMAQERYLNTLADILILQSLARRWIANTLIVPYIKEGEIGGNVNCVVMDDFSQRRKERHRDYDEIKNRRFDKMHDDNVSCIRVVEDERRTGVENENNEVQERREDQVELTPVSSFDEMDQEGWKKKKLSPHRPSSRAVVVSQDVAPSMPQATQTGAHAVAVCPDGAPSFSQGTGPSNRATKSSPTVGDSVGTQPSSPTVPKSTANPWVATAPRRKAPKNSASAFWEQKTASQPKPMFPPSGGRLF